MKTIKLCANSSEPKNYDFDDEYYDEDCSLAMSSTYATMNKSLSSLNPSSSTSIISLPASFRHPQSGGGSSSGSQSIITTTTTSDLAIGTFSTSAPPLPSSHSPVSTSSLSSSSSSSAKLTSHSNASKPRDPTLLRSNSLIRIETSLCDSDNNNSDSSCSNSSTITNLTNLSVNDTNSSINNNNKSKSKMNHKNDRLLAVQQSEQSYTRSHSDTDFTATSDNYNNRKELTVLLPFNHQVGGHTQLMLLDQSTLCKPLVQRELLFYLNIPRELLGFVPNYKGVVEIRHNESSFPTLYHPNKRITTTSAATTTSTTSSSQSSTSSQTFWRKPELRVQLCTCNDRRLLQKEFSIHQSSSGSQQTSSGQTSASSSSSSSRIEYSSRPSQRYFMLLENIASNYHLPCILDLKMGTRQHGDDASDEKRHRQMAKCAATTSATLGVRICGMQAYHKVSNNYYRLYQADKYHGRRIKNESGLKSELEVYFKNRAFLIGPIIKRLKELRTQVLETLRKTSLRFFSTSLLIVTEGCLASHRCRQQQHSAAATSMKHTNSDGEEDEDEFDEDDEEDEFGDNFSDDLEDEEEFEEDDDDDEHIHFDAQESRHHHPELKKRPNVQTVHFDDDDENSSSLDSTSSEPAASSSTSSSSSSSSSVESRYVPKQLFNCNRDHRHRSTATTASNPEVDVRMIDFAHTSFSSNSSSDGFMLGLENLIRLLNEIRLGTNGHAHNSSVTKKRRRSSNIDQGHSHSHPHAHSHHAQHRSHPQSESVLNSNSNKKKQPDSAYLSS